MHKNVKYILTTAVSWRMICPRDKSIFERGISNDYFIQNTYRLWLEANPHDAPYHRICVAKKGEFMPRTKKKITAQSKKPEPGRKANGMGSLRQKTVKGNIYWEGRYSVTDPVTGKTKQRSLSGKTEVEVYKKLAKVQTDIEARTYIEPTKITVGQWLEDWLTNYQGGVKPSTALLYRQQAEMYIIPRMGTAKLQFLTTDNIQKFYNELHLPKKEGGKGLSAKTVKNVHGIYHKALEQARKNRIIPFNPSDDCELPRIRKKEIRPLNQEQTAAFLEKIQGHTHEYLFQIALFTGMREGEILGLNWDSVDLDRGILKIQQQLCREKKKGGKYYISSPKNDKSRILVLAPSIVHLFRCQWLKQVENRLKAGERWKETGLVFTNPSGGYLSYRTVYDCFKRVMKKLGLPDVRFHDLRHTYATFALKSGDSPKTVQENLGHADIAFTLNIYGHVLDEMKHASASNMEKLIQGFATDQTGPDLAVSNG